MNQEYVTYLTKHVLDSLPLKPKNANDFPEPLGFLTKECWESSKSDSTGKFHEAQRRLSKKLLKRKRELVDKYTGQIIKSREDFEFVNQNKFSMPVIIQSLSGRGKSILISQLIAELLNNQSKVESNDKSLHFDRIFFSQLRNQRANEGRDLLQSVLLGLDGKFSYDNLYHFRTKITNDKVLKGNSTLDPNRPNMIMFVDSLDENSHANQWFDVTKILGKYGIMLVWSCRSLDWRKRNLHKAFDLDSDEQKRFEDFSKEVEFGLDLAKSKERDDILVGFAENFFKENKEFEEHKDMAFEFYRYLYSENELMHLFFANTNIGDHSEKIDRILFNHCLDKFCTFYAKWKGKVDVEHFTENGRALHEYEEFFNELPTHFSSQLIIEASLKFLEEYNKTIDVNKEWNKLCSIFQEQQQDELSDFFVLPGENATNLKIHKYFVQLGLLLPITSSEAQENTFRFRHRDFSAQIFIQNKELMDNEKEKPVFIPFFPENFDSNKNQNYLREFIRRNGNLIYWPLKYSLSNKEKGTFTVGNHRTFIGESFYVARDVSIRFGNTVETTPEQFNHVQKYWPNTIILDGYPGTGKTFTGIELLLHHQVRKFERHLDSKPLIVCLNENLAKHIREETLPQHSNSDAFKKRFMSLGSNQRSAIIESIDVLPVKQLLYDWAPDFRELSIFEEQDVFKIVRDSKVLSETDYRSALLDFQNVLFDTMTGKLIPLESKEDENTGEIIQGYTSAQTRTAIDTDKKKIDFYNRLEHKLNNQKRMKTIAQLSIILRNRLLYIEHMKSEHPNEDFNHEMFPCTFDDEEFSNNLLTQIKVQRAEGKYDIILVDEIQDLQPHFMILLSFLNPNRVHDGKYSLIISGDDLQTLNGIQFEWKKFFNFIGYLSKDIIRNCVHIYKENHHLGTLVNLENKGKLSLVHRNSQQVFDYFVESQKGWKSSWRNDFGHLDIIEDKEDGMVKIYESLNGDDFEDKLKTLIQKASSSANIALVVTNQKLLKYIEEKMESDEKEWPSMETFDIWNIKGLERKSVILVGSYLIENEDSESSLLFKQSSKILGDEIGKKLQDEIDHYSRLMLVAQSRAEERLFVLHLIPDEVFHKSVRQNHFTFKQLSYPIRDSSKDTFEEKVKQFFGGIEEKDIFTYMLKEGIELTRSASYNFQQAGLHKQSKNRILANLNLFNESNMQDKFNSIELGGSEIESFIVDLLCLVHTENLEDNKKYLFERILTSKSKQSNRDIDQYIERKNPDSNVIEYTSKRKSDTYSKLLALHQTYQAQGPLKSIGFNALNDMKSKIENICRNIERENSRIGSRTDNSASLAEEYVLNHINVIFQKQLQHVGLQKSEYEKFVEYDLVTSRHILDKFANYHEKTIDDLLKDIDSNVLTRLITCLRFETNNNLLRIEGTKSNANEWTYELIQSLFCKPLMKPKVLNEWLKEHQEEYGEFVSAYINAHDEIEKLKDKELKLQIGFKLLEHANQSTYKKCKDAILSHFSSGCSFDKLNERIGGNNDNRSKFIDNVISYLADEVADLNKDIIINFELDLISKCYTNLEKYSGRKYSKLRNDIINEYEGFSLLLNDAINETRFNLTTNLETDTYSSYWNDFRMSVIKLIKYELNENFILKFVQPTNLARLTLEKRKQISLLRHIIQKSHIIRKVGDLKWTIDMNEEEQNAISDFKAKFSNLTDSVSKDLQLITDAGDLEPILNSNLDKKKILNVYYAVSWLNLVLEKNREQKLNLDDELFIEHPFVFSEYGIEYFIQKEVLSNPLIYKSIFSKESLMNHIITYFLFRTKEDESFTLMSDGLFVPKKDKDNPKYSHNIFFMDNLAISGEDEILGNPNDDHTYIRRKYILSDDNKDRFSSYKERLLAYKKVLEGLEIALEGEVDTSTVSIDNIIETFLNMQSGTISNIFDIDGSEEGGELKEKAFYVHQANFSKIGELVVAQSEVNIHEKSVIKDLLYYFSDNHAGTGKIQVSKFLKTIQSALTKINENILMIEYN